MHQITVARGQGMDKPPTSLGGYIYLTRVVWLLYLPGSGE